MNKQKEIKRLKRESERVMMDMLDLGMLDKRGIEDEMNELLGSFNYTYNKILDKINKLEKGGDALC